MGEPGKRNTFYARARGAWRAWLVEHHGSAAEVWLLFFKKHTGVACVTLAEAVEEALCFGWIDGKLRRLDDRRHVLRFCPRRPRSVWSEVNKARVRRLTRAGLMTEAGRRAVAVAKRNGRWAEARVRAQSLAPPPDLAAALAPDSRASGFFAALAPSYRKMYVAWVLDAKRAATRARRIATVVARAKKGLKPGIDL